MCYTYTIGIHAQALRTSATTVQDIIDPGMTNTALLHNSKNKGIKGISYFQQEWVSGKVIDIMGKYHQDLTLSYQIFEDNLYIKVNDNVSLINKGFIEKFTIMANNKPYLFVKVITEGNDVYAEPLYSGKVKFYKQYKKVIGKTGNGYNTDIMSTYLDDVAFYLQIGDKKAIPAKMNKKQILASFPAQAKTIEEYWKKEKMKVKTEGEFVKTLQFIETII